MKRSRKGARRPPAATHPPSYPAFETIAAERGLILATLIKSGVPARDRPDVAQQVLLGAWLSVRRGMFRPDPAIDPRQALCKWIHAICWRTASHYRERASVRHEVIHPEPLGLMRELARPSFEGQLEAREVLEALWQLKPWQLRILLAVDDPESLGAYAARHGMNRNTAASRLRIAREALALKLRRWRR
ncbi:hypothetical protein SOCEGT47_020970 [Sorangium cellulosum]|uniref:RNA polymerase sigma-70 region 2 domain-containing protein n=1 Tax=Sorangium cellulosum TaxID=56 RepID=A0A4P2PY66_SORCE|nr:sigma-70 family RNA polymerase sigma factor [Sorangium cellulosum]AUX21611.1 hypothetical protein SOCEGT47_020970 [Sorangium cellulosum]